MPSKRIGGVLPESVSRRSVVSPGVKTLYQCSGIVSHQTSCFNIFENVQSQINPFPSRQYEYPFIPNENEAAEAGDGGRGKGGEEGTQNKEMIVVSKEIWEFALSKGTMIPAKYLPGILNVRTDWASRNFQDSSEWLLSPRVFQKIYVKWGFPELDVFTTRACHQIQSYLS